MSILRTTQAQQFDTLDRIAYRFFGSESGRYVPELVELNPDHAPHALLPMRATVVLPFTAAVGSVQPQIKIWD